MFQGDSYWKFYNLNLIYSRKISDGFQGVPNDIDASFVWGGNGKTYFIKGNFSRNFIACSLFNTTSTIAVSGRARLWQERAMLDMTYFLKMLLPRDTM